MSKPYYVTLTGCRNNAGDFLIRHRGHHLLRTLRPDRDIVDLNGWEALSAEQLAVVNGAQALILLGGPALRRNMYPDVYPLVPNLPDIKVPIIPLGVGWHASPGTWEESRHYAFTPPTLDLLKRMEASGFPLGVRDYRSLNALTAAGIRGGMMTGCPALYVPDKIGTAFRPVSPDTLRHLVISTGVNFLRSNSLEQQLYGLIQELHTAYPQAQLTIAFHHGLDPHELRAAYGRVDEVSVSKHQALVRWLEGKNIAFQDISGGVEKLLALYEKADFHVGYRVHAHICMSSLRKPSVLLTEDGRGRGLKEVLGGIVFDSWQPATYTVKERLLKKIGRLRKDKLQATTGVASDLVTALAYEDRQAFPRLQQPFQQIDYHYGIMRSFLAKLP